MTTSHSSELAGAAAAESARLRMELPGLLARVAEARDLEHELAQGLPRWSERPALADARLATLDALQDYAAGIEALSWPVPRSIVLEIRMHQILCGPTRM